MTQTTVMPAGHMAMPCPNPSAVKWRVLDDLRVIAPARGISATVLRSLHVLIGFIRPEQGDFTVYASNRSICDRLMGASERTVQRHIVQLAKAGLLTRDDSASGRRFRQTDDVCFGLNLRPLYDAADTIAAEAAVERDRRQAVQNRRRVLMARLYALPDCDDRAAIARALRAARTQDALSSIAARIGACDAVADTDPDKMPSAPRQNAGAILNTENESISVSKAVQDDTVSLGALLSACPEIDSTFGHTPRNWHDAGDMAAQIAGFIGITPTIWHEAMARLGHERAVTAMFLMLQRLPLIQRPAAYLRGLIKRCDAGRLNLTAQVRALLRPVDRCKVASRALAN